MQISAGAISYAPPASSFHRFLNMGTYELYRDRAGEFRFRLKARNGRTILASEGYTTRQAALNGIASVGRNADRDGGIEVYTTASGQHRFRVKAPNGQVVGASEGYASRSGLRKGVASVRANAGAPVKDLTA